MMTTAQLRPPPGPLGLEPLRFFGGGSFADTLAFLSGVSERYGPIASFRVLGRRMHLITSPELVREVLVVQQHRFERPNGAAILCDLVGRSMLTVDEPRHVEQRRVLQPAFHARRIAAYGAAMVEQTRHTIAQWSDGDTVDIGAQTMRLALTIVGRALFGSDVRDRADALEATLTTAMRTVSWLGPILEVTPPWVNALRLRLPLPANGKLASARRAMADIIDRLAAERAIAGGADREENILDLLREHAAGDARYDAQAVADELITMLLAGHETTANALAWSFDALARDPVLQARVRAELIRVRPHGEFRAADTAALPLTAAVFTEALRLYPPASAFGRRVRSRMELGGYALGPGDGIILSPYVSGRNPRHFDEPARFWPERWLRPAEPPPFAFFPFGGGARLCIGEGFARLEGTLVLATVLREWQLDVVDPEPVGIAAHATLRPARPIRLRLRQAVDATSMRASQSIAGSATGLEP